MGDYEVNWPGNKEEPIDTSLTPPQEQPVSDGSEDVVLPVDVIDVPEFSIYKSILAANEFHCGKLIS